MRTILVIGKYIMMYMNKKQLQKRIKNARANAKFGIMTDDEAYQIISQSQQAIRILECGPGEPFV